MCGRLSLFCPPGPLAERFDATPPAHLPERYNVAPGEDLAVLRADRPDAVTWATWGFRPAGGGDRDHVNARAETAAERPAFRDAFAERRCLVLADGFYEWTDGGQPYRVERTDGRPFAFGGLFAPGDGGATAAVLTTSAGEVLGPVHDRAPVVLPPGDGRAWLDGADAALDPPPAGAFERYPVSQAVNDPATDDPSVVERVAADRQGGLGEF